VCQIITVYFRSILEALVQVLKITLLIEDHLKGILIYGFFSNLCKMLHSLKSIALFYSHKIWQLISLYLKMIFSSLPYIDCFRERFVQLFNLNLTIFKKSNKMKCHLCPKMIFISQNSPSF